MTTVYILINDKKQTYVGCSNNFTQRFQEHNNIRGKSLGWTRTRGPWNILHCEECPEDEAWKREKYFKTGIGREYIQKLISEMPG